MAFKNEADRKIYFYKVVPENEEVAPEDWSFNRSAVATAISQLAGDDFYLSEDGGDKITCAEAVGLHAPQKLKFFAIRRRDLPSLDSGTGTIGDLDIAETEGLAEAVHLGLYPNGVVAFESFYYGPRISRVQAFLNARCADALGTPVVLKQFVRSDAIEQALKFNDIRVFHVKVDTTKADPEALADAGLTEVMGRAGELGSTVWAEVRLRAEADDAGFTSRIKGILGGWKDGGVPKDILLTADVEGADPADNKVAGFSVLSDALVRTASIPRQSARSRALDSDAAFDAIHKAWKDVKDKLPADGLEA